MDNKFLLCNNCNQHVQRDFMFRHYLRCNQFSTNNVWKKFENKLPKGQSQWVQQEDKVDAQKCQIKTYQLQYNDPPLERQQLNQQNNNQAQVQNQYFQEKRQKHNPDLGTQVRNNNENQQNSKCAICLREVQISQMQIHLQQCYQDQNQPYKICKYCGDILDSDELQQQHEGQCIQNKDCPYCHQKVFGSEQEQKNHIRYCQLCVCEYCGEQLYPAQKFEHQLKCWKNNSIEGIKLPFEKDIEANQKQHNLYLPPVQIEEEDMQEIQHILLDDFQMKKKQIAEDVEQLNEEQNPDVENQKQQKQQEPEEYEEYEEYEDPEEYFGQIARQYSEEV